MNLKMVKELISCHPWIGFQNKCRPSISFCHISDGVPGIEKCTTRGMEVIVAQAYQPPNQNSIARRCIGYITTERQPLNRMPVAWSAIPSSSLTTQRSESEQVHIDIYQLHYCLTWAMAWYWVRIFRPRAMFSEAFDKQKWTLPVLLWIWAWKIVPGVPKVHFCLPNTWFRSHRQFSHLFTVCTSCNSIFALGEGPLQLKINSGRTPGCVVSHLGCASSRSRFDSLLEPWTDVEGSIDPHVEQVSSTPPWWAIAHLHDMVLRGWTLAFRVNLLEHVQSYPMLGIIRSSSYADAGHRLRFESEWNLWTKRVIPRDMPTHLQKYRQFYHSIWKGSFAVWNIHLHISAVPLHPTWSKAFVAISSCHVVDIWKIMITRWIGWPQIFMCHSPSTGYTRKLEYKWSNPLPRIERLQQYRHDRRTVLIPEPG